MRVETTVNNPVDFALHKTLTAENWRALRRVGTETNARFLAAIGDDQPGLPDPATLESVVHQPTRGMTPKLASTLRNPNLKRS